MKNISDLRAQIACFTLWPAAPQKKKKKKNAACIQSVEFTSVQRSVTSLTHEKLGAGAANDYDVACHHCTVVLVLIPPSCLSWQ